MFDHDVAVRRVTRIASRILDVAPGLFNFALHLLGRAFHLCACVAGPFAHLTLRPARDEGPETSWHAAILG